MTALVKEGADKEWICIIGQAGRYSDAVLEDYYGKKVDCFGEYYSKIDDKPALELILVDDNYCINDARGKNLIASGDDLVATEEYLIKWSNDNLEDIAIDDTENKTGTYKSTGVIKSIYTTDSMYSIDLVQCINDTYTVSYITESYNPPFEICDMKGLSNYHEGDGITLYYVINDIGHRFILGYDDSNPSFTLDDYSESTSYDEVLSKEYTVNNCSFFITELKNRQDGTYSVRYEIEGEDEKEVGELCLFTHSLAESIKEDSQIGYSILGTVKNSGASVFISNSANSESYVISGVDSDGTSSPLAPPSWYIAIANSVTNDSFSAFKSELNSALTDFSRSSFNDAL